MSKMMVKDIQLSYEMYGEGRPILFLHGAYLSKGEWVYQIDAFSKKYRVIALDMPGHGDSGRLDAYSVEVMANYIHEFIGQMGIRSCVLCGHSLGGMVTQAFAIQFPESVEKIILADTSYGIKTNAVECILTALTMPILKYMKMEKQAKLFAEQMGKHNTAVKEYVYQDILRHTDDPRNYQKIWDATADFNSKKDLHKIPCPALILAGALNIQTHRQAKTMGRLIPDAKLVFIENAGHMLNMDNPEAFNREVERFMEEA